METGIFTVVSLIFLNSVYNLFTDGKIMGEKERQPMVALASRNIDVRQPASTTEAAVSGFVPYETKCPLTNEVFETTGTKVRITGPYCDAASRRVASLQAIDTRIENVSSRYIATVFNDRSSHRFSTDFIPLESGVNKILIQFLPKGGKAHASQLTIVRK